MAKSTNLREFAQFTGVLRTSGLDPRCIDQAAGNVPKLIEAFEAQPENRTGQRVRKSVRKAVRRTLRHLTSAARHVGDGSPSRAESRKLIRFAGCCDDFSELACRASQYRGRHNKIVSRINDRKAREGAREIPLDDLHSALEVKTVRHLMSVGKQLRNCLGGDLGSDHREDLRTGESEFWALRRQGKVVGLLSIDVENRRIEECGGVENEPIGWSRKLFLDLQRSLNAVGDEVTEIAKSGAFAYFLDESVPCPVVTQIGERTYEVWADDKRIIICDDRQRWSHFRMTPPRRGNLASCADHVGSTLDVEELVFLVAACPKLANVFVQNQPKADPQDNDRPARRRRRRRPRRERQ